MVDLSARRIVGFACNQGFTFFVFYLGLDVGLAWLERIDLLFILLFLVVGFALLWRLSPARREQLMQRPLLFVYAAVMAAAALAERILLSPPSYVAVIEAPLDPNVGLLLVLGALVGLPNALLLAAWGRSFSRVPTATSVPEVMTGSLIGALLALVFYLVQGSSALFAIVALPLISAAYISATGGGQDHPHPPLSEETTVLSLKILLGTFCFGASIGFMDTYGNTAGVTNAVVNPLLSLILFAAFATGALSLLLTGAFGRGAALNKSYRLAVFVMMLGFLLIPFTQTIAGDAVVLAGYLALEAVLVSLFLVIAAIAGLDTSESFSRGFSALFAGELVGVVAADVCALAGLAPYASVVFAGALVLLAYIFLFTERDFLELSEIADTEDAFEAVCAQIVERFGLSNRESQILPLALRGRTAERIAGEFTVTKSTVDTHLRRIYAKCGVHSRQELIDLSEHLLK